VIVVGTFVLFFTVAFAVVGVAIWREGRRFDAEMEKFREVMKNSRGASCHN
jgi:hypothetical protein